MGVSLGGIEAGPSQFVCAIGDGLGRLDRFLRFDTTTPTETIGRAVQFFEQQPETVQALGVGAFGPPDLNPESDTYGTIRQAHPQTWYNANLLHILHQKLDVPVVLESDVNAAAIGEQRFGAGQDVNHLLYVNVGGSIGTGTLIHGTCLHGLAHPALGHLRVRRAPGDTFEGMCPLHGDCLNGLASGQAVEARTGIAPRDLPDEHPVWDTVAHYVGEALAACTLLLSPERIVLGGGMMQREPLLPKVRRHVYEVLGGYPAHPVLSDGLDAYIVPNALKTRPGVLGALALARDVVRNEPVANRDAGQ